ncbi:MAG: InlB B-repeat-containing protein [Clostridia bacterium]|nr:InlB B-repeat-containing protein [Clostridia bacterium]
MRWIKHNFATVLAVCLVIVFGVMAVVLPDSIDAQAVTPEAPNVTLTDNGDGTYDISGTDATMEYNTVSETHTIWKACTGDPYEFTGLTNAAVYYFRVKATETVEAGAVKTVFYGISAPTLNSVQNTGEKKNTVRIENLTEEMEYNTEGPLATTWTKLTAEKIQELQEISETGIYYIRTAAKEADGENPAVKVSLPCRVVILIPKFSYIENGTYNITGLSERFEYKKSTEETWIKYTTSELVGVGESATYNFRVIATADEAAGQIQSVDVKVKPAAPTLSISHNEDGTTVKINGVDETMEYTTDPNAEPTAYVAGALDSITKPLDETFFYYVRLKATDTAQAGFYATVEIPLQERPAAPELTITDNEDETVTVTSTNPTDVPLTTVEYNTISADAVDSEWITCDNADFIVSTGGVYYFRVKANGGIPAGNVTRAMILILKDNGDHTVRIDGIDDTMEYRKNEETTWTPCTDGALDRITESGTYYVRIQGETEPVSRFDITITVISQPAAPDLMLTINGDETATVTSTLAFNTLEYNTNSATAEDGDWTACTGENLVVADGGIYYFRVKAVGETPAGAVTTALILIQKENGDNTVRIDGMNETMWYTKDVAGTWAQYTSGCEMDNISETSTYYVKLSETSENYSTITVTFSTPPEVSKYAVTFEETDKGTLSGSGEYEEGATVIITAIVNSGYSFNGWEVVSGGVTLADETASETTFTMVATPVSIKATFTANTYTITLEGQTQEVTFGQPYGELPTPTQEGSVFGGWYLEPEYTTKIESTTTVTIASDHTLYARWTTTPLYAVTVSNETSERGSVSGSGEYEEGDTVTITATANEGYTFSSWEVVSGEVTLADATATEITFTMVGTEVSIKANFIANTYTITLGEGGEERAVTYGQPYGELPTPTQEGSVFGGWYLEPEYTTKIESTTTVTTASDHTLYAKWTTTEAQKYTVTVSNEVPESGNVSGSGEYEENATVTITVTANEGYTFSGWKVVSGEVTLADATAAETTFTMVGTEVSIKAKFIANTYTITLEGQTQEVTFGQPYGELPTPTKEEYVFDGWYLDTGFTTKVESTTIVTTASDHTLYAKWNLAGVEDATIAFVWDTTNQLTKTITVETGAATKIDWGDGMVERIPVSSTALELSHTYVTEGAYTVKIEDDTILYLDCSGMKLNTLNVIKNTKLTVLICSDNQLERLDVSENTELVTLDCSNNKLEKLDISENTALKNLYCGGNQLETLNIKNNTKLVRVCCVQETLKKVYVTATQNDKMTIKNVTSYCNDITSSNIIHKHKNTSVVGTSSSGSSSGGSSSSGGGGSVTYPTGSISSSSWKNKFTDVTTEDWYYEAIKYVNKKNYFSGTTTTTFSPNDPTSREMIVTVLYNMEKRPITYGPNNYWDVPSGSWSEPAIVWASKYGIVSGYPQGNFAPAQPITREELATILKKYSEYKKANLYKYDYGTVEAFVDKGTISDWAVGSMVWATSNDLMKGTYGYLLPQKSATRAEVAAMIMNYCEK